MYDFVPEKMININLVIEYHQLITILYPRYALDLSAEKIKCHSMYVEFCS